VVYIGLSMFIDFLSLDQNQDGVLDSYGSDLRILNALFMISSKHHALLSTGLLMTFLFTGNSSIYF
jgi:hypothetical protein